MGITKWIKGRNGKFLGSIGAGKNTTPTDLPQAPAGFPGSPTTPDGTINGYPPYGQSYEQYLATRPTDAQYFEQATNELENTDDRFGGTVAEKINFKVAAAKYAESPEGQIAVLEKAQQYLRDGNISRAADLVDAAAEGRTTQDKAAEATGQTQKTANSIIAAYDQNDYDRVETSIAEFRRLARTPHTTPAFLDQPERHYPFNPMTTGEALGRVAGIIDATRYQSTNYNLPVQKSDVYGEHLVEAAHKLSGIRYAQEHPGQPEYVHGDYFNFIDKVENAHRTNYSILNYKITRQLGAAQLAKRLLDPNYGQDIFG
jgi:hypothetical protein